MEREMPPCACTVAGSDSGGGAGVQADLKTFHALGVWGLSAITAVTAQNTREVRGAITTGPDMVALQIATLCEEFEIRAFKTGMLADRETIRGVASSLPESIPLVLDPVMISTSGHRLLAEEAEADLVEILLPRATVVTPNIPEAEILANSGRISTLEDARRAGREILSLGPEFVLVKGGHLRGDEASDLLLSRDREWLIATPRYRCRVHGAGCCFSAALCAFLAHRCPVPEAFGRAKSYMNDLVRNSIRGPTGVHLLDPPCRSDHQDDPG